MQHTKTCSKKKSLAAQIGSYTATMSSGFKYYSFCTFFRKKMYALETTE